MIRRLFSIIVFVSFVLAAAAQGTVTITSLIRARYLLSENKFEEAYTILNNQQFSGSEKSWSALTIGKALSGLKRYEEANTWLQQVSGDGAAEATYCMAKNYLFLNDIPNAIGHLGKHLSDKNHFSEKYIRLDGDFSKIDNTRDWVHLWQSDWYSETELQIAEGIYLISQGQVEEAGSLAENLLTAHSAEPRAWLLKARVHLMQKEERLYREALDRAWQLAADNLSLRNDLLHFALESGNFEKVNEMAADLLRRDPSNPEYIIDRALVRILEGKESLAVKEIETVEKEGITATELYYQASLKILLSSPAQAEAYLTKAIDNGILDSRFFYARGLARNDLEKTDLALDDLAMSLDINPNQPELYLIRAKIRLDQGDTEGACHDWQKALSMGNSKAADQLYKYCRLP